MTKEVIVVGGGFSGLNLAKNCRSTGCLKSQWLTRTTITSFRLYYIKYLPHFIEPSHISYPFRKLFQEKENLRFHLSN